MPARDAVQSRDIACPIRVARRDGHRLKPRLAIGYQVTIAHDEPGADAADADVLAPRHARQIAEGKIEHKNPQTKMSKSELSQSRSGSQAFRSSRRAIRLASTAEELALIRWRRSNQPNVHTPTALNKA